MNPLDILFWSLLLGATSAGMTTVIRALPFIQRQMQARSKPWACDVCMSFWTVGGLVSGLAFWQSLELIAVCGPAFPWALWVLRQITGPLTETPMPELEE